MSVRRTCIAGRFYEGELLYYTTSHDVLPGRRLVSFVGYAAILFAREGGS